MRQKLLCSGIGFFSLSLVASFAVLDSTPTAVIGATDSSSPAPYATWKEYGGSPDDAQYSALKQINRSNVAELKQVWFYPAGNNGFRFGSNPIVIDGVMYAIGENNSVVALDAATGKEIWEHDTAKGFNFSNRGLMYWESKDHSDRRVLYVSNNRLWAINARTGDEIPSFGDQGAVDLKSRPWTQP